MTPGGSALGVVVRLDTVDSTQSVAFALAERGAADRTVVVADQQLAGRGRRGRTWSAPTGTSLLASIIVRPRLPQALLSTLSLTAAVAAAEALRRVTHVDARLKWPNDVLVSGRKIAGILLESRMAGVPAPGGSAHAGSATSGLPSAPTPRRWTSRRLARSIGSTSSPVAFTTRVAASGFAIFQYACAQRRHATARLGEQSSAGPTPRADPPSESGSRR